MDAALARFRSRVLDDPVLREQLLAERDPHRFAELVAALARAEGIEVGADTVTAEHVAARRRWHTQWVAMEGTEEPGDPPRAAWPDAADWTPWRLSPGPEGAVVEWCHTAGLRFDDPFFAQTLERAFRHPFRLLFGHRTALGRIATDAARAAPLPIAGVVLHMSRCGSTLVAQMLDAVPSTLVLSEPGPVDSVLRLAASDPTVGPAHVRGVIDALARPRAPEHEVCVLKLDAWAVVDLPLLRAALPGVPWVFCHRDPEAVLASHRRVRGFHVIPGTLPPSLLGWDHEAEPFDADAHAARVLARLCRAALEHRGPDGIYVDHAELPAAVADRIAPHLGLVIDAPARAAMDRTARRDAKNPVLAFEAPVPAPADPALAAAAARWLTPVRDELVAAGRSGP